MNRCLKHLFLLLMLLVLPSTGWAQRVDQLPGAVASTSDTERIAAVVNDNVISTSDINARIKLAMLSAGLPDTAEIRMRLTPQILRGLIDEQLEMQEAKRLDVTVSKEEVDQALARIAHDNNIPGGMESYITEHGGSADALTQQIRAGLSWNKVVQRELRPNVDIGDDEVDAVIGRMKANAGKDEYLVSEIVLPVDSPKDEDQVKDFADNLVQQIKGGASFGAIARQFSQGTGAAAGGDIGWIQDGQLASELNRALVTLQPGQITDPIRSSSGYHILGVREKRVVGLGSNDDIRVNLQQAFRPLTTDTDQDKILAEANQIRTAFNGCAALQVGLEQKFPGWRWNNLGDTDLNKIPADLADKVRNLTTGQASEAIATDKGALVLFMCERHVPEIKVDREAITNSIGSEKLELQSRRLLRDLRRNAYLDVRMMAPPS
jgi:peptidyl-prolyl cis-trans isomerase SurA